MNTKNSFSAITGKSSAQTRFEASAFPRGLSEYRAITAMGIYVHAQEVQLDARLLSGERQRQIGAQRVRDGRPVV